MPRPRLRRVVGFQPGITYFKPQGKPLSALEEKILTVDEFESIRLKDFQELGQKECAEKMGISQPTFHRLVLSARKKIADAIINGKAIRIRGGNFKMVQGRGRMQPGTGIGKGQGAGRGIGAGTGRGSAGMGQRRGRMQPGTGMGFGGPAQTCICPSCQHEEPKQRGVPCVEKKCPKCGAMMTRGQ